MAGTQSKIANGASFTNHLLPGKPTCISQDQTAEFSQEAKRPWQIKVAIRKDVKWLYLVVCRVTLRQQRRHALQQRPTQNRHSSTLRLLTSLCPTTERAVLVGHDGCGSWRIRGTLADSRSWSQPDLVKTHGRKLGAADKLRSPLG